MTPTAEGTSPTPAAAPTETPMECFAEFPPTTARTLHFVLTARDCYVPGGGLTQTGTTVTVAAATPFTETNPADTVPGNGPPT